MRGFISKVFLLFVLIGALSAYEEVNITTPTTWNITSDGFNYVQNVAALNQSALVYGYICSSLNSLPDSRCSRESATLHNVLFSIGVDLLGSADYFLIKTLKNSDGVNPYTYIDSYVSRSGRLASSNYFINENPPLSFPSPNPLPAGNYTCPDDTVIPPDISEVTTIWAPFRNLTFLETNYSASNNVLFIGEEEISGGEGVYPFYFINFTGVLTNQSFNLNETTFETINTPYWYYIDHTKEYTIYTSQPIKFYRYVSNISYCYLGYCNYFKGAFDPLPERNYYKMGTDVITVPQNFECVAYLPTLSKSLFYGVGDESTRFQDRFDYYYGYTDIDEGFKRNISDYDATFGKSFNTLAYVLSDAYSAGFPNYGITVEVQNEYGINRYLITSGLEQSEGFYTDFNLRHYLDCNIYDGRTDNAIPLFFSLDGGYVWVDVASACTSKFGAGGGTGGGATYNETAQNDLISGILCGDNKLVKVDNYTIRAEISSNHSITFWWKYLNGSTGQVATTGVVNYTVGDSTNPVVQGKILCDGKLLNVLSTDASTDYIRSDKGVVFVLMFIVFAGLMFLTRSITLNVAVTVFIIIAFWLLKFIKLDVAFIIGMTVVGLAIIALARWGEEK